MDLEEQQHSLPSVEEAKTNVKLTTQSNINRFNHSHTKNVDNLSGSIEDGFGEDFDRTALSIMNKKQQTSSSDKADFYDQYRLPSVEELKRNITTSAKVKHTPISQDDDDDDDFYKKYAASTMLGSVPSPPSSPTSTGSKEESRPLAPNTGVYGMHTNTKKNKGLFRFGCNLPSLVFVLILLIGGLAIGLTVGLKEMKSSSSSSSGSSNTEEDGASSIDINPSDNEYYDGDDTTPKDEVTATYSPTDASTESTISPTLSPTSDVKKSEAFNKAKEFLKKVLPNPGVIDDDILSAQAFALEWITMEDTYFTFEDIPTNVDWVGAYDYLQRYVMAVLYYGTRGKYWDNQYNFMNKNKHVCQWFDDTIKTDLINHGDTSKFGITCDEASGTVIEEINTFSNNLNGKLPPELSLVTTLKVINMQDDFIYGEIPTLFYTGLSNLGVLNFYSNELTGTIPTTINNLKELHTFDVSYNELEGPIPSEIGECLNLEVIDISSNGHIDGSIPDTISKLSELGSLEINDNDIRQNEFPSWINGYNFPKLSDLRISNNNIAGSLPADLGTLSNTMTYLYLDGNQLDGNVEVLNYLKKAQVIMINDNLFSQDIGGGTATNDDDDTFFMKDLKDLTILDASNNLFMGNFPPHLLQMESLSVLDLSNNKLGDDKFSVFPEIKGSANINLEYLSLFNNQIGGLIPGDTIEGLTKLTHLDLSNNNFSFNDIPTEFGLLTDLSYLFLTGNGFTKGPIPNEFENLTNLKELSLGETGRDGPFPKWIGNLKSLILLDLHDNSFSGVIPEEVGDLDNLRFLILSGNNFTGPLPRSLADLDTLEVLVIHDNKDLIDTMEGFLCHPGDKSNTRVGNLKHFLSDCDRQHPTTNFVCPCCTACCASTDVNCESDHIVDSLDGDYESGYGRINWDFAWNLAVNGSEIYDSTGSSGNEA